jgi:hypothetical protein
MTAESVSNLIPLSERRKASRRIYFDRVELSQLLQLYSGRVATGEWRDYAIDHGVGIAVFSIFRHTLERPLFAIVKTQGAGKGGADYTVFTGRQKLARATTLRDALTVFDRPIRVVP